MADKPTVGILSMQKVLNYGSFLQAYALKQLLEKNGADNIYYIDIIPGRSLVENSIARKKKIIRYPELVLSLLRKGKLISGVKTFLFTRKQNKRISNSWRLLELEKKFHGKFDLIVIGSDEVFNCCQDSKWGYSRQLYGDISKDKAEMIVSYAGSFGHTTLEQIKECKIDNEIAQALGNFLSISVRDENSAMIIEKLTGQRPQIHIDPVLAYGFQNEINNFKEKPIAEKYMIVYSYQDRINNNEEIHAIRSYAKNNNLKLISIFCRYDWCDVAVIPSDPLSVLKWFKFADNVVTDTFHGSIFSIITHSNFATLIRPSNKNKLYYLLSKLQLTHRIVSQSCKLNEVLNNKIRFKNCDELLTMQRKKTEKYLQTVLNA